MNQGYDTIKKEADWPRMTLLKRSNFKLFLVYLGYIFSLGILFLLSEWLPSVQKWAYSESEEGNFIMVEEQDGVFGIHKIEEFNIKKSTLDFSKSDSAVKIQTFIHRYIRYYKFENSFVPISFNTVVSSKSFHSLLLSPLSESEINDRKLVFGKCLIDVAVPSIPELVVDGVIHPFFIFQIFSCVLWVEEEYYIYASAIIFMSIVTLVANLWQTRENITSVRKLAHYDCPVNTNRGTWQVISSADLVPGDIIEIGEGVAMPCDVVLVKGLCLVDESMLTGESQLVVKEMIPNSSGLFYHKEKKFTISAGTLPSVCRDQCIGIVIATGFMTAKGELVQSILFPKPNRFKFYTESFKFIGVLAVVAIFGFMWSCYWLIRNDEDTDIVVIRSLDLITIVIPPVLPLVMTIGTSFSIYRLQQLGISCISLPAVNAAGRVSVVCFDKTGTITEDFMSLKSVHTDSVTTANSTHYDFQENMSTCHSLTFIREKIQGDHQEIAIFESTKWSTLESDSRWSVTNGEEIVTVIHVYHFSSETKRMGVVVTNSKGLTLHMKGAPEIISKLCTNVPSDFVEVNEKYTREGYRVLACACKKIESFDPDSPLEEIEQALTYLGLLVLENPLKADSADTVRTLQAARIRCVISTGDNQLTGIAVARSCNVLPQKLPLYTGEFINGRLKWLDPTNRTSFLPNKCCISITGEILEYMVKNKHPDLDKVIEKGYVFGRMYPHHKIMLIELLQKEDTMVAMVGDGANDCGALKIADVGLSLSKAEASIAAPFSSSEIKSIINVLKEGRAALVTSFQSFKFVAMYSVIQFTSVCILYAMQNNFFDSQFLYQDLIIILPISISMAHAGPYHMLVPELPPGALFSVSIISSILGHVLIQGIVQVGSYLLLLPWDWYVSEGDSTDDPEESQDNTTLFIVSCCQLLIIGVCFNIGPPYRRDTVENFWFTGTTTFIILCTVYLLMVPEVIGDLFHVIDLEADFKYVLLIWIGIGFYVSYIFEKTFLPKIDEKVKY